MSLNRKNVICKAEEILDEVSPDEITFLSHDEPFRFLISVILSAQTTDERVNMVSGELFGKYPDCFSLAKADIEDVKQIIRSTGFFNNKAKNIILCSQQIVENFNGKVPVEMEELLTLAGVGRKTANCLRANVLGLPGVVVDTHFSRVVARLIGSEDRNPDKIEELVVDSLAKDKWSRFSMTANLHGRKICHAFKPECESCPLKGFCVFLAQRTLHKSDNLIIS